MNTERDDREQIEAIRKMMAETGYRTNDMSEESKALMSFTQ